MVNDDAWAGRVRAALFDVHVQCDGEHVRQNSLVAPAAMAIPFYILLSIRLDEMGSDNLIIIGD